VDSMPVVKRAPAWRRRRKAKPGTKGLAATECRLQELREPPR